MCVVTCLTFEDHHEEFLVAIKFFSAISEHTIKQFLENDIKNSVRWRYLVPLPMEMSCHSSKDTKQAAISTSQFCELNNPLLPDDYSELFQTAQNNAYREAVANNPNDKDYIALYKERIGNTVGVIAEAGIGKSKFLTLTMNSTMKKTIRGEKPFIFYIKLGQVNWSEKIFVIDFLVQQHSLQEILSQEMRAYLLKRLKESGSVYLFFDCLDEMDRIFLKTLSPVVDIEEKAYPDQILKNILAGDLLPRAKKFLSSRLEAWIQLHPKYRPHFTVRLLGLNKTSQETLIRHLCANESEFTQVVNHLAAHPNIRELCYNPMYCILITTYILQRKCDKGQLITVTDLCAEVVYQCVKSRYFKGDPQRLKMITALAISGIAGKHFSFKCNKSDKDDQTLETFMKVELAKGVKFGEKILETEKHYLFTHRLWQEFFAALHLMYFADLNTFSQMFPLYKEDRLRPVVKFMFGFYSPAVNEKLKYIFADIDKPVFHEKLKKLLKLVPIFLSGVNGSSNVFNETSYIFEICSWALEGKNAVLTNHVALSLPSSFKIVGTPTSVQTSALAFVLEHSKNVVNFETIASTISEKLIKKHVKEKPV